MKRATLLIILATALALPSCNRSTCPTFDENPGEKALQGGGKTKSGIYPKDMKKGK